MNNTSRCSAGITPAEKRVPLAQLLQKAANNSEMLAIAEGERLWTYWQKQLGGDLPILNLPTDRPRPQVVTYCGAEHAFKLSEELTLKLKALSSGESTLYMTLLAAFFVLLYRYTGTEDILVGFPTTGRSGREFSRIVGNFINPVVLRADLSGNPTFNTFLDRVCHTVLAALNHQDYPFALLVEQLHPPQDTSRSPLFQVMFIFNELQRAEELSELCLPTNTSADIDFGGLIAEPFDLAQQSSQFDLTLEIKSTAGSLTGIFNYNTDLFDASTIARMTGHFQTLLEGVVGNPGQLISTLPLLTESERLTLLVDWNNAQVDYPNVCIHQMFEDQVERTPEAIAVVFATEHLTYRQLNNRANCLAHHLQILGVEPEVLVGICLVRSLDMVVALLGILKAGGAYVFLDPAYPKERLTFMLEETQVPVLLTQVRLVEKIPEHGARVVYLDTGWEGQLQESGENPATVVAAQNLAYVMYTSGSTGRPKGVTITHGSVRHYVQSINTGLQINANDVYLHTASFSFSSSVRQLLVPLSQGAKVLIATYEQTRDPLKIFDVIQKHKVTVFDSVRAFWQYGLEALEGLDRASRIALFKSNLRLILFSGGLLTWEMAKTLLLEFEHKPRIVNIYGQTETIGASLYPLPVEFDNEEGFVPTGKPISNTQIYILNSQLDLVPIGVLGELHVGGAGLARGYLNRPDLTSEQFIANPFCNDPAARIYKTGDLARYLPDGNIENLGRIDDQVKLRGMRVELGEIESVLGQHPAVQTTVVMAREDKHGEKSLVAYIVPNRKYTPNTPHTPSIDSLRQNTTSYELRRFLKEKLPEYMIPSVVMLDALPLTPNGKVDRRALPTPNQASLEERAYSSEYVAPQDIVELELTKIWEELLGVQPIGVRDNFFELGGHSMLAVSLFTQIEKKFGKNLPLATLLHATTVEQLSSILRQEEGLDPWSMLVAIQTAGDKPPLFCVHGADGNILVFQNLARHLGPEQPVYALQAKGLDGKEAPHTQVEAMAADYIRLMRTVQLEGAYLLAGFSTGGVVVFEMAQQLYKQGHKVALVVLFDSYSPAVYYKPSSSHNWVSHHLGNILRLGPKGKLNYFVEGTKAWLHKIRCKLYPDIGLSLTQAHKKLLPTYNSVTNNQSAKYINVFTAQKQAVINYVPQAYCGRLILFRSAELPWWLPHDLELGWGELAAGGLEIQDIPGDHHNILRANVRVLSEKLRVYLDEVQTSN